MILPAITLYQPWATWIMREWKTIETRTHNRFSSLENKTILIHAGLTTDSNAINNPYLTHEQLMQNPDEVVNGYILGSAFVYKHSKLDDRHSKASLIECENTPRWGLFLTDIKPFKVGIRINGEVGIWYFDIDKNQKVLKPKPDIKTLFS